MHNKEKKLDLAYWIGTIFMVLMVTVVIIQVIFRFAGHPLSWPEEVARWFLVWITFGGAGYCFRNGGLISVDYFVKKFFPKKKDYITAVSMLITVLYFVILLISAILYCKMTLTKGQVYPITRLPYAVTILALIIGCILASIHAMKEAIILFKKKADSEDKTEGGGIA